jgi:hypothetical protein
MPNEDEQQKPNITMCARHEQLLKDIHLAVCGNDKLGVSGLVEDVRDLKRWKSSQDIRSAGVAGIVTGVVLAVKAIFTKVL